MRGCAGSACARSRGCGAADRAADCPSIGAAAVLRPLRRFRARGRRWPTGAGAGRRERRAPGRLVIHVRGSPPPLAMLVDDVHTTGATLDASARALTAAGTRVVAAITYARTL